MSYKYRKWIAVICCGAMALGLTACSKGSTDADGTQQESTENGTNEAYDGMFTERDLAGTYDESEAIAISLADDASTCNSKNVTIEDNVITITAAGVYVLSGTLSQGQIVVDAKDEKVQLVLNNAQITCAQSAAIYVKAAHKVFVTLPDGTQNAVSSTGEFVQTDDNKVDAAIFSKDKLTLNGEGVLTISCESGHGVVCKDDLRITGGTYVVTSAIDGFSGKDSLRMADGNITITAGDDGMHSDGALTIWGGTINITECYEGLEGLTVTIHDGDIQLYATDDGMNAAGESSNVPFEADSDCYIEIDGGTISINADGDGIDSNGDLLVTGGTIYVCGPTNNGDGALDYDGTATITGGTIVAVGASGMAQNFGSDSTQGTILVSCQEMTTGDVVLLDADGSELLCFTPEKEYNSALISCAEIETDGTYTIQMGEDSQTITMDGVIYGASDGFPGGMQMPGNGQAPDGMQAPSDGQKPSRGSRPQTQQQSGSETTATET